MTLTPQDSAEIPLVGPKKFGTFAGVYVPTLLTILGVIMYLRQGWVIGNAGLVGSFLIILMAFGITAATGLAMSSITTNIRIGAGGAYSIISQSLGLEVGGSVGIPLYLAQALAVTLYVFGFREGWLWVFPDHPTILVDLGVFALIWGIANKSAEFAFRIQYVVLAIIALSLVSVAAAGATGSMQYDLGDIQIWGNFPGAPEEGFPGTSFWIVFAVFFPAATGIMAGANMSGDLKDPRRSIPIGTMAAIGTSFVIYLLLAYWLVRSATPEELVADYTIMIERAYWGPAVLAGLLGATFSSALASFVGAPRILQALGEHNVLPKGEWLSKRTARGEPRNAMMVTAAIVFAALLLRDLNAVAPIITMFFLITYAMINTVVFIEQSLGLVSFRPLLRIPRIVSFLGLVGCLFAMFIINPAVSLIALALVFGAYMLMARRTLHAPFGDVRSGLFVSVAEWAAKKVWDLPTMQERAWKPNLLVAVKDTRELRGAFLFIQEIAYPKGSVKLVGLRTPEDADLEQHLDTLANDFRNRGVFANWIAVESPNYTQAIQAGIQTARGAFPRPNIVFLQMPEEIDELIDYGHIVRKANDERLASLLYAAHPKAGLGRRQSVNIWIRDRTPDWSISMDIGNLDLSILLAYKLKRNWKADLRIIMAVEDEAEHARAREFLEELATLARIPHAEIVIGPRPFLEFITEAPQADLNIFGMDEPSLTVTRKMVELTGASCIFVRDSGDESALA
ncbi:MAG: amino acid permease [Bradymonadaceae bacterium]